MHVLTCWLEGTDLLSGQAEMSADCFHHECLCGRQILSSFLGPTIDFLKVCGNIPVGIFLCQI